MLLWIAFVVLTGLAVLAVLGPLALRREAATRAQSDIAVYKDQLSEIERDQERGLIAGPEAEAARLEVSRRLLEADAASGRETKGPIGSVLRTRFAAVVGLVAVPVIALGVYGRLGSPDLPDLPLASRLAASPDKASIDELVARVETHLQQSPEDGEGWDVIAPVYLRAGRFDEARKAFDNAIRILGPSAQRQAFLGEAIRGTANGVITADARIAFEAALKLDPGQLKARYYLGLAAEQDGDKVGAATAWQALVASVPTDSPMAAFLRREIARVGGAGPGLAEASGAAEPQAPQGPGPTAGDIQAAQGMSAADRGDMIKTMVARLATRLAESGGTQEEWLKLIRAYVVLGDKAKALGAAADARKALAADPAALKSIDDVVKSLGLEG